MEMYSVVIRMFWFPVVDIVQFHEATYPTHMPKIPRLQLNAAAFTLSWWVQPYVRYLHALGSPQNVPGLLLVVTLVLRGKHSGKLYHVPGRIIYY